MMATVNMKTIMLFHSLPEVGARSSLKPSFLFEETVLEWTASFSPVCA